MTGASNLQILQTRAYDKRRLRQVCALTILLTEGEKIRQRRGASLKQGCPFYVAFTEAKNDSDYYRCSGINAGHLCARDPDSVDRYHQYRKGDSVVLARAATMMRNGVRAGPTALVLKDDYESLMRPRDIHRVMQTNRDKAKSLSDAGVERTEMQRLINEIENRKDQYRIKYQGDSDVMECLLYWNPADMQLARRFYQVIKDLSGVLTVGTSG